MLNTLRFWVKYTVQNQELLDNLKNFLLITKTYGLRQEQTENIRVIKSNWSSMAVGNTHCGDEKLPTTSVKLHFGL